MNVLVGWETTPMSRVEEASTKTSESLVALLSFSGEGSLHTKNEWIKFCLTSLNKIPT